MTENETSGEVDRPSAEDEVRGEEPASPWTHHKRLFLTALLGLVLWLLYRCTPS